MAASSPIFRGSGGLDIMPRMQLAALSMGSWVDSSKCLACIPFSAGVITACAILGMRGFYLLAEGVDVENYLAEAHFKWGPPRVLLFCAGLGDLVCAFTGLVGLLERQASAVMWLLVWPAISVIVLAVALGCTLGVGGTLFANVETEWEIVDMILFGIFTLSMPIIGFQILLSATLRWTMEKSMLQLISEAGRVAFARQDITCDKRHMLAVLLYDQGFQNALRVGGADVERMKEELTTSQDGIMTDPDIQFQPYSVLDAVPLGIDTEELIHSAARIQWSMSAEKLSADHLVMALCDGGEINVYTGHCEDSFSHTAFVGYPLNSRAVREHLEELGTRMDTQRLPAGPPGAPLFGCLPLEECILTYLICHVAVNAGSMISIVLYRKGLGWPLGLRNVPEMQALEFLMVALGAILGLTAISSILNHRRTRFMIRKAAYNATGEWDTDLRSTFDKVRSDPRAHIWRTNLFKAGNLFGLWTIWMPLQCILSIPVVLMYIADSNVCHAYWTGISWVSNARLVPQPRFQAPLHCTGWDILVLSACIAWALFEAYIIWGVTALWHEYAYGWTTTDLRGAVYVEPSPLPEALAQKLAGVGTQPVRRGRPANVPATEATPLLI